MYYEKRSRIFHFPLDFEAKARFSIETLFSRRRRKTRKMGKCENASETRQQRSSRLENARRADPRTPARKGALLTALLKLRVEVSSTDYTKDFVAVSPVTACRPSSPRAMFPTTVGRFAVSRCRKRASAPRESCGAPAFGERRPRGAEGTTPSGRTGVGDASVPPV